MELTVFSLIPQITVWN